MFLAFAEKRKSAEDSKAESLVMRKGEYDNGYLKWNEEKKVEAATMTHNRTMNPCPVYDKQTNKLFLFFNCIPEGVTEKHMKKWGNQSKMCYVTSEDYGETWSSVTDITDVTSSIRNLATVFLAPGHGIQTESGKLVVPAYVYVAKFWFIQWWCTSAHSFYLYSEDHGEKWRVSERIHQHQTGECELAEITDTNGKKLLYCNARATSKNRIEATTDDGGKCVDSKQSKLIEIRDGCMGSVVSFPAKVKETHWLLYSHPTKESRNDLGIYFNESPMDSGSWSDPWIIYEGPSAYSDLAHCTGTDKIGVLFESGKKTPYEEINFCLIDLYQSESTEEDAKQQSSC